MTFEPTEQQVERVAKALARHDGKPEIADGWASNYDSVVAEDYRSLARAAIRTMSEGWVDAGVYLGDVIDNGLPDAPSLYVDWPYRVLLVPEEG